MNLKEILPIYLSECWRTVPGSVGSRNLKRQNHQTSWPPHHWQSCSQKSYCPPFKRTPLSNCVLQWINTEGTASFPTLCLSSYSRNLWSLCPSQHGSSYFLVKVLDLMGILFFCHRTPTCKIPAEKKQEMNSCLLIRHALCQKVTRDSYFGTLMFLMCIRDNSRVGRQCQSATTSCNICWIGRGGWSCHYLSLSVTADRAELDPLRQTGNTWHCL